MTDQERPVEERNELLDDLLDAASVAVQEPEASKQDSQAADEQPEPAAQLAEAPVGETTDVPAESDVALEEPAAEAVEPTTSEADESDDSNAEALADDARDEAAESAASPGAMAEADSVASATVEAPAAEEVAERAVGAPEEIVETEQPSAEVEQPSAETEQPSVEAEQPTTEAEQPSAEAEQPTAEAEQPSAEAEQPSAEAEQPTAEAEQPSAEAEAPAVAQEQPDEAAQEGGASYTPVAEEESGRPRRVKDLEAGMELEGRVTSIALYGIFVDIGVGRDGLVHISEMSDTRIDSPSDVVQIGDTVKVRIKSVEPDGRRISLTMRSKERGDQRSRGRRRPELNREALAGLKVGENIEGTVTGIAPFGVFVDIGVGKDGLVHVSELAEGRIDKPEDAVQVGQSYTFKILEVDADGTRISLSLRRAQRGQRIQQLEKGQILEGVVSGLAPFGAFVDIGVGRDGLIHISEMSEGRIGKVEDAVKVGDKITVRVLDVDSQSKRISLSLRLEDRPREDPAPRAEGAGDAYEDRGRREDRGRGGDRPPRSPRQDAAPADPVAVAGDAEEAGEEFEGNATLEDLLSKFSGGKRDRKRRQDEEEEEDDEDRYTRRQRDAIRRTLQQMGDEE